MSQLHKYAETHEVTTSFGAESRFTSGRLNKFEFDKCQYQHCTHAHTLTRVHVSKRRQHDSESSVLRTCKSKYRVVSEIS